MPFPPLAHQGPVLPQKLLRPSWFDTTASCTRSVAHALEYTQRRVHPTLHGGSFAILVLGVALGRVRAMGDAVFSIVEFACLQPVTARVGSRAER